MCALRRPGASPASRTFSSLRKCSICSHLPRLQPSKQRQVRTTNPHSLPITSHRRPKLRNQCEFSLEAYRKIRDLHLTKNLRPDHAKSETQHSLKCMCRQTSPTRRSLSDQTKHVSYFDLPRFCGTFSAARALVQFPRSDSPVSRCSPPRLQ